jgi:uncharacterized protein (TIGR00369 family)
VRAALIDNRRMDRQPQTTSSPPEGFRPLPHGGEFISAIGPLYVAGEGATMRLGFRVETRHTNPLGICHGGMLSSFCDMLLPITVHHKSQDVGLRFLPTINLQLDFLAPAQLGAWVEGVAEVLRATRSLVFVQGLASADGKPCVRASGIFKIGPAVDSMARTTT